MTKISAKIIADSKNEFGDRISTLEVVLPRIILAEKNTHRMMSRNSASSRAIPFKKMLESVKNNPFIPMAWQKDHPGMQGTEYLSKTDKYELRSFISVMIDTLEALNKDSEDYKKYKIRIDEKINIITELLEGYEFVTKTLDEWWLFARDKAIEAAAILYVFNVTKQLCNRLLEPFMWHTVVVTATEWENFFSLRCPKYVVPANNGEENSLIELRSKKEVKRISDLDTSLLTTVDWLKLNKGQAEIHMMELAECIWDAMNESTPKQLKAGEWHIPFGEGINTGKVMEYFDEKGFSHLTNLDYQNAFVKIATARCARVSYTVVGEEGKPANYDNDIKLHENLSKSGHWSPFEHCAQAMNAIEYGQFINANPYSNKMPYKDDSTSLGWSGNLKGFIQYRKTFKNENITK
jgi:hypothetical protein